MLPATLAVAKSKASVRLNSRRLLIQKSPIAGFQYHEGENVWPQMKAGDTLKLAREPDNPHDPKATAVYWKQHMIGYVPRAENTAVAQMMDRGERLNTRIARLGEGPNPWDRIEMEIHLAS